MDALVGREVQLPIGGFVFRVRSEGVPLRSPLSHGYVPFLAEPQASAPGEVVHVSVAPAPDWAPRG